MTEGNISPPPYNNGGIKFIQRIKNTDLVSIRALSQYPWAL